MARAAGGFIADLVARIMRGFTTLAPVFVLGCQGPTVTPAKVENKPATIAQHEHPVPNEPKSLGDFTITFYYVIGEDEISAKKKKPANDNQNANDAELTAVALD